MTKFTNGFEIYEADKIVVRTIRTVEVIAVIDVRNWDDDDGPIDEEELSIEATSRWLKATDSGTEVEIEGISVDYEEIHDHSV